MWELRPIDTKQVFSLVELFSSKFLQCNRPSLPWITQAVCNWYLLCIAISSSIMITEMQFHFSLVSVATNIFITKLSICLGLYHPNKQNSCKFSRLYCSYVHFKPYLYFLYFQKDHHCRLWSIQIFVSLLNYKYSEPP